MALGGLPPDGPNDGSPCWPIPVEEDDTQAQPHSPRIDHSD